MKCWTTLERLTEGCSATRAKKEIETIQAALGLVGYREKITYIELATHPELGYKRILQYLNHYHDNMPVREACFRLAYKYLLIIHPHLVEIDAKENLKELEEILFKIGDDPNHIFDFEERLFGLVESYSLTIGIFWTKENFVKDFKNAFYA